MTAIRTAALALFSILAAAAPGTFGGDAPAAPAAGPPEADAARILGTALTSTGAHDKLTYLCDRIGHRLSGSPGLERAVAWTAERMREEGVPRVWTDPVDVPHWVRGDVEEAVLVAPRIQPMAVTALGGTVATPDEGIEAEVLVAHDFDDLDAAGEAVRGKIVLFHKPIEAGFRSEHGYGSAAGLRVEGPSRAAGLGAVGMLIRSLGTADFRLPHTGSLRYDEALPRIPSAAISAEDADQILRLTESGETVRVRLRLNARTLPDAPSHNVIGEIRGREKPDEIVVIGGHLDSWDAGCGAHDDGAGVVAVMEALRVLATMDRAPRRTIRGVLFTNEENGLRGGRDYAERYAGLVHVAAAEMDSGGFAPRGYGVSGGEGAVDVLKRIVAPLAAIGADETFDRGGGADIGPLAAQGTPLLSHVVESDRYFDYHHTEADTLDKVDPGDLQKNAAALAWLAWALAESEDTLPRRPPQDEAAH